jgi:hypothetical protein
MSSEYCSQPLSLVFEVIQISTARSAETLLDERSLAKRKKSKGKT